MNKTRYFLIPSNLQGVNKILYDAMCLYISKNAGKEIENISFNPKGEIIGIILSSDFIFAVSKLIIWSVASAFYTHNVLPGFRYNNIDIGRYAAAAALRDPEACYKKIKFNRRFVASLVKGIIYHVYALRVYRYVSYAYLGDTLYLKGIVIDTLLQKQVATFMKFYPYGLVTSNCDKLDQLSIIIHKNNREGYAEDQVHQYMNNRLENPKKTIPYYKVEERDVFNIQNKYKYCAVIYAHSFTDVQLNYGYTDKFKSVYEWLTFTLNTLIKANDTHIILKGHPNFWAPRHEAQVVGWDKKIWRKLVKQYENNNQISIIDWPLNNYTLLKKLDKESTLLISHHGNALVEGAYLGYKTLSSVCSLWGEKYNFGEVWEDPAQYLNKLLDSTWDFNVNQQEACRFIYDNFMNPYGSSGYYFFMNLISLYTNIDIKLLMQQPSLAEDLKIPSYNELLNEICRGIANTKISNFYQ
ncbi:MAG: hypothetical protein D3920_06550 [Candidatus Electrothrix sp. AW2]|nr:hypothetical protein [Candidatus Electrothrix gigas]